MNQIATQQAKVPMSSVSVSDTGRGTKIAPKDLNEVVKFAEVMCRADIALPKHLRGNAGACMAVAMQALEWELSPFAVASKSYAVNGAIAYEAQLIAAVVNTRSGIKGRLRYRFEGEGNSLTCTVTGVLDGEECSYTSPTIGSITTKNSPLWKSDPQQQLGYFSARSWARRHCPEVILGVYDRDEAEEFRGPDNAKNITPAFDPFADDAIVPAHEAHSEALDGAAASTAPASKSAPVIEYGDITDTGETSQALPDTDGEGSASIPEPSDDEVVGVTSPPAPATSDTIDAAWLKTAARMLWGATSWKGDTEANLGLLNTQRLAVADLDESKGVSQRAKDKAGSIYRTCKSAVMQEVDPTDALKMVAGLAGTTEAAITGKEDA
jgi:hypothetical protein